jgi:hypothetical protein
VRLPVILQPVMKLIKWHRLNHAKFSSSMLVFSHRRKLCSARHGAAHMHAVAHHCKLVLVIVRPERLTNTSTGLQQGEHISVDRVAHTCRHHQCAGCFSCTTDSHSMPGFTCTSKPSRRPLRQRCAGQPSPREHGILCSGRSTCPIHTQQLTLTEKMTWLVGVGNGWGWSIGEGVDG